MHVRTCNVESLLNIVPYWHKYTRQESVVLPGPHIITQAGHRPGRGGAISEGLPAHVETDLGLRAGDDDLWDQ